MKFTYSIEDEIFVLCLEDNLMEANTDMQFIQLIDTTISDGILNCAIDLSGMKYMNSTGLGVLVRILAKFRNKGGEVVLIQPSESISKLLIVTKLNAIFTITQNKKEAIQFLKGEIFR